jgi:hypothetical protein
MKAPTLIGLEGRQATWNQATRGKVAAGLASEFTAARDRPPFGPELVRRPRLLNTLLRSPPARLVLLAAPAGYSKTTALAEWETAEKRPFAWLTAHARHDDAAEAVVRARGRGLLGEDPLRDA